MGKKKLLTGTVIFAIFTFASTIALAQAAGTDSKKAEEITNIEIAQTATPDEEVAAAAQAQQQVDEFFAGLEKQRQEEEAAQAAAASKQAQKTQQSVNTPVGIEPNYAPGDGSRWDQLAQCEAGGNWATNTGNGFGGGLQFMHGKGYSTWLSFGGGEFAPNPWDATREQQIIIAEKVLASSGWGAWPGCSRKFGWL
jgi:hypothetical protein